MDYRVEVVEDHDLPEGTNWVIAHDEGGAALLVKRHMFADPARMCVALQDAWVAWNELGRPVTVEAELAWWQRRRALATAAGVAAALVVAVPSPVAAVVHG